MRIRGKISKVSIAAGVAASTFRLCAPASAQERSEPSTVVVYGDASRDWVSDVQRFADVLNPGDRSVVLAGDAITLPPCNVTLVWFGDLWHLPTETAGAPDAPDQTAEWIIYRIETAHLFEQAQAAAMIAGNAAPKRCLNLIRGLRDIPSVKATLKGSEAFRAIGKAGFDNVWHGVANDRTFIVERFFSAG